jgi:hypothetical protein
MRAPSSTGIKTTAPCTSVQSPVALPVDDADQVGGNLRGRKENTPRNRQEEKTTKTHAGASQVIARPKYTKMNASALIEKLQELVREHGDLDVTCAFPSVEYSACKIGYASKGPMPAWRGTNVQRQNLPDRFMIELKDDIPSS